MFAVLTSSTSKSLAHKLENFDPSYLINLPWQVWEIKLVLEQVIATADQDLTSRKVKFTPNSTTRWRTMGYGRFSLRNMVSFRFIQSLVSSSTWAKCYSTNCFVKMSNLAICLLLAQTRWLSSLVMIFCMKFNLLSVFRFHVNLTIIAIKDNNYQRKGITPRVLWNMLIFH